jgi:hypothetical protein
MPSSCASWRSGCQSPSRRGCESTIQTSYERAQRAARATTPGPVYRRMCSPPPQRSVM